MVEAGVKVFIHTDSIPEEFADEFDKVSEGYYEWCYCPVVQENYYGAFENGILNALDYHYDGDYSLYDYMMKSRVEYEFIPDLANEY